MILNTANSQIHSIDIDYNKDLMYCQGWGGKLLVVDISFIEQKYLELGPAAWEEVLNFYFKDKDFITTKMIQKVGPLPNKASHCI